MRAEPTPTIMPWKRVSTKRRRSHLSTMRSDITVFCTRRRTHQREWSSTPRKLRGSAHTVIMWKWHHQCVARLSAAVHEGLHGQAVDPTVHVEHDHRGKHLGGVLQREVVGLRHIVLLR